MKSATRVAIATIGMLITVTLTLTGCSGANSAKQSPSASASSSVSSESQASDGPRTVTTCDFDLTLAKTPEKVMFQNASGVAQLAELGLLDKVIARSGVLDTSVYSADDRKKLDAVPVLKGVDTEKSHVKVSTETLLETNPDLVVGFPAGLDIDKARASGVNIYVPKNFCPNAQTGTASFEDIYTDLRDYGTMFGMEDKVESSVEKLKERIEAVEKKVADQLPKEQKSVAILWITPGDISFRTYGTKSMSHLQAETIGLRNVYGDQDQRVFDSSVEELLERDPDEIILLHNAGTPQEIVDTFMQIKGVDSLRAVRNNEYTTLSFQLTDPPSPLSVKGLEDMYLQVHEGKEGS